MFEFACLRKRLFTFYHHGFQYRCSRITGSFGRLFLDPRKGNILFSAKNWIYKQNTHIHKGEPKTFYFNFVFLLQNCFLLSISRKLKLIIIIIIIIFVEGLCNSLGFLTRGPRLCSFSLDSGLFFKSF